MACIWVEGFETFKSDAWLALRYTASGGAFSSVSGKNGGSGGASASSSGTVLAATPLGSAVNTLIVSGWIKLDVSPSATGKCGFGILKAGSSQVTMRCIQSGDHEWKIELRKGGSSGTVIATQTGTAQFVGQWYFVELKATINSATGSYEIRVNGSAVMSGSGVDTAGAGSNQADGFQIRLSSNGVVDDVIVLDTSGTANNDFTGPVSVEGIRPTSNGNQNDWTASTGANYTAVDDDSTAALQTDRVYAQTLGDIDLYGYGNLQRSGASPTILAVMLSSICAMDASGTRDLKQRARSGGSEDTGATFTVPDGTQRHFYDIFEENPVGPTAWTLADLNAIEFGIEVAN